jgi:hypothetical protein
VQPCGGDDEEHEGGIQQQRTHVTSPARASWCGEAGDQGAGNANTADPCEQFEQRIPVSLAACGSRI